MIHSSIELPQTEQKLNSDTAADIIPSAQVSANALVGRSLSTREIQEFICQSETLKFNIPCENVKYLFSDWEIDVLSLNKSDYLTEFEVKISRSDFKADAKKKKWVFYQNTNEWLKVANYFYYACPKGLITESELPSFAGLIYVSKEGIELIKKAPLNHKHKHDRNKVLTKFCRIMSERKYLGSCRLTFENNKRRVS